jgi:beta-glucanase (GH16 family)
MKTLNIYFLPAITAFTLSILFIKQGEAQPAQAQNMEDNKWSLVWSDEFDQETISKKNWTFQVEEAGRFNEEWQRYTDHSENAYLENNCLVIEAKHVSNQHGMDQYTSARLHTANKQSWKYGKISAKIKLPEGKGIWPAFWMLGENIDENGGDTPWPQCGEIDILELYGTKDDGAIEVNAHYADSSNQHAFMGAETYKLDQGKFSDHFHVFDLEWTSEHLKWYVDGNKIAEMDISGPYLTEFHKPFFLLLNIAVGGTFAGRPDDATVFPQKMYIDWVRVYQEKR